MPIGECLADQYPICRKTDFYLLLQFAKIKEFIHSYLFGKINRKVQNQSHTDHHKE